MLFTQTTLGAFSLFGLAHSHMLMSTPVPFGKSTLNNSPLNGPLTGTSDFPCKQRTGVYATEGASNTMALGSSQKLAFIGSAVHGGGSCQISITYDQAPTASSTWKVIHSIEGGCPAKNTDGNLAENAAGTGANTYTFTMPTSMPTGTAVLAWTWFNKVGNREMYMNCAPITITAGASKRSDEDEELMRRNYTQLAERDTAAYNALPDMFVANIPDTTCKTVDGDLKFPNPGTSLDLFGTSTLFDPTGTCGAVVGSSGGSSSASPAVSSKTSVATKPATTMVTSAKSKVSAPPASQGGVFVTVPTSGAAAPTSAPVVSQAPAASSAAASKASPVASSAAPVGTGSVSSGSAFAAGTACTTEGLWNCIGGTSFQQCGSGTWSVVQSVAAGTKCTGGQSMSMGIAASKGKRAVRASRWSGVHLRRHLHS